MGSLWAHTGAIGCIVLMSNSFAFTQPIMIKGNRSQQAWCGWSEGYGYIGVYSVGG